MPFATMMSIIMIFVVGGALYLAYCCGRCMERKAKAEEAKVKAKAKAKAAKAKVCKHLNYTRAGSNQHKLRKRCTDCGEVFEITDVLVFENA